jgi:hypothetical protein
MSGGYFNYDQHRLNDIKQSIEELIRSNKDTSIDEFGDRLGKFYTKTTINKFYKTMDWLSKAEIAVQRIDYLVSSDDSEESFHEQWVEDLNKIVKQKK